MIGYVINGEFISQEEALKSIYYKNYESHFEKYPEDLEELEKIYKNPNLKLPDVAGKLNIIPHQLSQLVNDNLGKSFSTFINEYRIEAAKKMLLTHDEYSLDAIGYEAGFNSKSTFYAAFKKVTGTTPARYKKEVID